MKIKLKKFSLEECLFAKSGNNNPNFDLNLEQVKHVSEHQKFTNRIPWNINVYER